MDRQRFGIHTAKALCLDASEVPQAIEAARTLGAKLLILRVPANRWASAAAAQQGGGILTDILDHYHWSTRNLDENNDASAMRARDAKPCRPSDADEIADLARAAFAGYESHYHRDPGLDVAAANEVYPDWARRACLASTEALPVIATRANGRIVGFAALRRPAPDAIDVALFAVHPSHRSSGLGALLLREVQEFARASGAAAVTYSTQVENTAARRLVTRCGFVPAYTLLTFHCWI